MESSQPGLNFSPVNRAEIVSRLHEFKFQLKPRMKSQPQAEQSSLKIEVFCFCEEFKVLFTVNDRLNAAHRISAALGYRAAPLPKIVY
jgi:thiamine monophosphate synthase